MRSPGLVRPCSPSMIRCVSGGWPVSAQHTRHRPSRSISRCESRQPQSGQRSSVITAWPALAAASCDDPRRGGPGRRVVGPRLGRSPPWTRAAWQTIPAPTHGPSRASSCAGPPRSTRRGGSPARLRPASNGRRSAAARCGEASPQAAGRGGAGSRSSAHRWAGLRTCRLSMCSSCTSIAGSGQPSPADSAARAAASPIRAVSRCSAVIGADGAAAASRRRAGAPTAAAAGVLPPAAVAPAGHRPVGEPADLRSAPAHRGHDGSPSRPPEALPSTDGTGSARLRRARPSRISTSTCRVGRGRGRRPRRSRQRLQSAWTSPVGVRIWHVSQTVPIRWPRCSTGPTAGRSPPARSGRWPPPRRTRPSIAAVAVDPVGDEPGPLRRQPRRGSRCARSSMNVGGTPRPRPRRS